MKQLIGVILFLTAVSYSSLSQPAKKSEQKPASQQDMNKLLEDAMKAEGMSIAEQEEIKKYMKNMMPALQEQANSMADYPTFNNNLQLLPRKDPVKISALKKALTKTDILVYTNGLLNKLIARGDAAEIAQYKKIIAQNSTAGEISSAAVLAMMQGQGLAALALHMKALTLEPGNLNFQNNMAASLTSYGYPEHAIPVLRKLRNDLPYNSTIFNNLGHAWLGLGMTDSAAVYIRAAARQNPHHAEAREGSGLIEELNGDPGKAAAEYKAAMENAANPFTEQMLKNVNKGKYQLDIENLMKTITVYEFFPKDYLPNVPLLVGGVNNFANNEAEKAGYAKMMFDFAEKMNNTTDILSRDLNKATEQGEVGFITEMMKENQTGVTLVSKYATIVMNQLLEGKVEWLQKFNKEQIEMMTKIAGWRQEMEKITEKNWGHEQCQIPDDARNKFMERVNPIVRKFYLDKAEELRMQLNALATWNWYVTGNIKNVILMQDIAMTGYLVQMYEAAIKTQEVMVGTCSPQERNEPNVIPAPEFPNFLCPVVISIPVGPEWQELDPSIKDFDKNHLGLKSSSKPIPNVSVSFAASNTVAEPGRYPSIITSNGSIAPSPITRGEEKGVKNQPIDPLKDYQMEREIEVGQDEGYEYAKNEYKKLLERSKKETLSPEDKARMERQTDMMRLYHELLEQRKARSSEDLINQMMKTDCVKETRTKESVKDHIRKREEQIKQRVRDLMQEGDHKETEADNSETEREIERLRKEFNQIVSEYLSGLGVTRKRYNRMERIAEVLNDYNDMVNIRKGGLQPTINNGVQSPGTFTTNKNLFQ